MSGHQSDEPGGEKPAVDETAGGLDFRTLFAAIDIPTIVLDADGNVLVWNDAEDDLVGIGRDEVTGLDGYIGEALYEGERSTILAEKVLAHPQTAHEEYDTVSLADEAYSLLVGADGPVFEDQSTVPKSGAEVWFIATPLYDGDDLVGVVEFTQDRARSERRSIEVDRLVTEISDTLAAYSRGRFDARASFDGDATIIEPELLAIVEEVNELGITLQHMEELENSNERLRRFANVVSHDLRNPINVALGHVELLERESDHDSIAAIDGAIDRMNAIIEDVLTLARQGRTIHEPKPVDLADLVAECWRNVDTDGATFVVDTEARIEADDARLRGLFENLFRNAVEHGSTSPQQTGDAVEHGPTSPQQTGDAVEHGPTSPDSQTRRDAADDGRGDDRETVTVRVGDLPDGFFVADDGAGIPEDERENVFETGYSTTEDGTGFGLDIVAAIAEAHGWQVAVTESGEGGARFEFTGVTMV